MTESSVTPSRRIATLSLVLGWIGVAALLVSLLLLFVGGARHLPLGLTAGLAGAIAIVLVRLSGPTRKITVTLALIVGLIALWLTALLAWAVVTDIRADSSQMHDVSIAVSGEPGYEVFLIDSSQVQTVKPPKDWTFPLSTATEETKIVFVRAPEDSPESTVSCTITWEGEVVFEKSGAGEITCHYRQP